MARIAIVGLALFFVLVYVHTLVLIDISLTNQFGCMMRPNSLYHQIYTIAQVFIYAVFSPFLMVPFGSLTIFHTKGVQVQPARIVERSGNLH